LRCGDSEVFDISGVVDSPQTQCFLCRKKAGCDRVDHLPKIFI